VATMTAAVRPAMVAPGGKATLTITLNVEPGFHINANDPGDENLIPLALTLNAPGKKAGVSLGKPVYPTPTTMPSPMGSGEARVHEGKVTITVPVTAAKTAKGKTTLTGKLRLQGCNETTCYPPKTFTVSVPLVIGKAK
jgi:DsbC/DsbD-like thiol-disulfide interchange protein